MIDEVTDEELARFADWAEKMELGTPVPEWKKAYQAIRQGSDWILRRRALSRYSEVKENVKVMKQ